MPQLKGFFNPSSLQGNTGIKKTSRGIKKTTVEPGEPHCNQCGLQATCKSSKMPLGGEGKKEILIIAEAPGEQEDIENTQLVGKAGKYLEKELSKFGINLHRDCWKINAVNCRPPNNRTPTQKELQACKPFILSIIEERKPKAIFLLGDTALKSYFLGRVNSPELKEWVGLHWPDLENKCWIFSIYHPSFGVRNEGNPIVESELTRQISKAVSKFKILPNVEPFNYEDNCFPIYEYEEVVEFLNNIIENKPKLYIDYETTGLKPFNKEHRIESVGIGFNKKAYAFPYMRKGYWYPEQFKKIRLLMRMLLSNKDIKKVAHNANFELLWSRKIFDIDSKGFEGCTMLQAHTLDSRKGIKSLKRQVFLRFGVMDYDSEMDSYLKASGANDFNNIHEAPLDKLLLYNAADCFFTEKLDEEEKKDLERDELLNKGSKFLFESGVTMYKIQYNGICSDLDYYKKTEKELSEKIDSLEEQIYESEESKFFTAKTGRRMKYSSNDDLKLLLFDLMKIKSKKKTATGKRSTDAEVLNEMDIPLTRLILEIKKISKVRDTYLSNLIYETNDDGRIHPFFNLYTTRTYRSSSSNPNWQNIPSRDEFAKSVTRKGVLPSSGNRLSESDYGSQEVRVAACYTEDPVLIKYIEDPTSDMHRDEAKHIFVLNDNQWTKGLRFCAKNGWVFPEFYGSYYVSCAKTLWDMIDGEETTEGQDIKDHLADVGLYTYDRFEKHLKMCERRFWSKFRVFKKWQKTVVQTYIERGYVEMFFGFKRDGYLSRNKLFNTAIQGTAFHCLLWSLNRVQEILEEEKWNTKVIGQIHDSIIADNDPNETDKYLDMVIKIAAKDIREAQPRIIVPLEIEPELTRINGSWYEKEAVIKGEDGVWFNSKSGNRYTPDF